MRARLLAVAAVAASAAVATAAATATIAGMHPHLAARLSGMGEHGIVNLTSNASKGRICWTFDVPTKGITGASIRDRHGMKVAELGMHYTAKGCDAVAKTALDAIESHPARYDVWVATKGHPGELRGMLYAGMAHM
jgi:exo-beta-1,3-glucanase (GH17 family)